MSPLRLAAIALLAASALAIAATASAAPAESYDVVVASARPPAVPASFLTHDGGWLALEYPPSARERVAPLLADADDVRAELADALGQPVLRQIEVRVARGADELATLAPESAPPPAGLAAVAYPKIGLVVLSLAGPSGDSIDVGEAFRHELAHVALEEATLGHAPPRWLAEGFAMQLAGERPLAGPATLVGATIRGRLLPLSGLDRAFESSGGSGPLAAAQASDFVRYLRSKGPASFAALVERLRRGEPLQTALETAYAQPPSAIERAWRDEGATRYGYVPIIVAVVAVAATAFGVSSWRSAKRRRATPAADERDEGEVEATVRPRAARLATREGRIRIALSRREDRLPPPHIPDAEVPKVEHGGRWHTLH